MTLISTHSAIRPSVHPITIIFTPLPSISTSNRTANLCRLFCRLGAAAGSKESSRQQLDLRYGEKKEKKGI